MGGRGLGVFRVRTEALGAGRPVGCSKPTWTEASASPGWTGGACAFLGGRQGSLAGYSPWGCKSQTRLSD